MLFCRADIVVCVCCIAGVCVKWCCLMLLVLLVFVCNRWLCVLVGVAGGNNFSVWCKLFAVAVCLIACLFFFSVVSMCCCR